MDSIKKITSKYSSLSVSRKSALWITLCSILQKGISFVTVPIFTRIMPQEDYGIYQVYQSWLGFFLVFTSLNLASGSFNKAMIKFEDKKDQYVSSMQILILLITTMWFILFLIARDEFCKITQLNSCMLCVMFLELALEPAYLLWTAKKRFDYSYKSILFVTLSISVLMPVVSFIAVSYASEKAMAKIISGAVTVCIIYLVIFLINMMKGKVLIQKEYWKYALKFNIPLIPHYLSITILSQADRVMINNMCSAEAAAIYSIATNVSLVLVIVANALNSALTPWLYRMIKANNIKAINRNVNIIIITASVVASLPIFLAPEFVAILAPSSYYEAIWIVPPIAASTFFVLVYSLCSNIEFYYEKKFMIMVASLVTAIVNVVTNYIFIGTFGYIAAGYTTVASYILLAIFHCVLMKKTAKHNGIENIINIKVIVVASVIMCILVVGCVLLYNYMVIRYMIIGLVIAIVFAFRPKIKEYFFRN